MRPTVPDRTGVVLLDKKPGMTSFQALYPVKRLYGRTVGHTGTLDSFAEGLLVVLVGKFTKFNPLFTAFDKVYEADFTFGAETDTLDPTGTVVFSGNLPPLSPAALSERWVGELDQIPPDYSAIHVDGQRASDRVRSGQTLALAPRRVTVYSLEVLAWASPVLSVRIHCSKGTYVRSIARDWGRAAGCGAHVSRLRRLSVGPFPLPAGESEFKEPDWVLDRLGIPVFDVDAAAVRPLLDGRPPEQYVPELAGTSAGRAGLRCEQGIFAVAERRPAGWGYLFVDRGEKQGSPDSN
jgi:tRNA pseudouridine(55) synthase